jgi:DNA-binding CsgD family transcriptional regulator/tetratricopeptide (TPR) repeat protein
MELVERDQALAALDRRLGRARRGVGSVVLVHGEAGVGKTWLLRAWTGGLRPRVPLAWGSCDPLSTPSPLAPLREVAFELGGAVLETLRAGSGALDVFVAFVAELRQGTHVVVFEDLHWADEATLDLVRYTGRRIETTRSLLVLSFRDDEAGSTHRLQTALGELSRAGAVVRVPLRPLSRAGVARMLAGRRGDADAVYERTGGNPFFVTEVVAHAGEDVPASVRDAVLARLAPLGRRERRALETLACVPGRVDDALAFHLLDDDLAVEDLIASGLLSRDGPGIAFRHELARLAVVEQVPAGRRRAFHGAILAALERLGTADAAVLTHHAVEAGAPELVVSHARRAAADAAAAGAHREAASFLATALEQADRLAAEERAELLESRAYELFLTDRTDQAIAAREQAARLREEVADRLGVGANHRWISRLSSRAGRPSLAERHAALAVELLEGADDPRELGFAYSNRAHVAMLAGDDAAAVSWGERALRVAEQLGDVELRAHALISVGSARAAAGDPRGRAMQRESVALAREHGLDEQVARGYTNLSWDEVERRHLARGESLLREALAFVTQREIDSWRRYMLGCRARLHLLRGRLTAAADDAATVLSEPASPVSRIWPLLVLGLIRSRRADPGADEALAEAWTLATQFREAERMAPVAAARAEHAWITGTAPPIDDLHDVIRRAGAVRGGWPAGEAASWLHRLGGAGEVPELTLPRPFALQLAGDATAAAAAWRELGCPFEAAVALTDADNETALLRALEELTELGAEGTAGRVRRRLRELGVSGVPRGPRPATRANPAQLTARQVEVLELLAAGLTNAEIAEELVISPKTAGHHVSAILDKLGARSRLEAANAARQLGLAG